MINGNDWREIIGRDDQFDSSSGYTIHYYYDQTGHSFYETMRTIEEMAAEAYVRKQHLAEMYLDE